MDQQGGIGPPPLQNGRETIEQGGIGPPPLQNVDHSTSVPSSLSPPPSAAAAAGPAPFLLKTYDMVDDASTDAVVSWSPSGTSFVVWDPQHFCQRLLPRYFKHSNFSSFIRQLNIYGFRKSDPDKWAFANRGFVRGQRHLLQVIRRRTSAVTGARHTGASSSSLSYTRDHQQEAIRAHANVLRQCDAVVQCTTQMQDQLVLVSYGPGSDVSQMDTDRTSGAVQGEQSLQEEIVRMKREKTVLTTEVMRLRQELQSTEQDLQSMWQRLQATELRQYHLHSFMTQAGNLNNQANIVIQQQHQQIRSPSQQQIPWQPFNVSSVSAQHASPNSSSEIGRPRLSLPLVESTDSLTTSDTKRTGFQLADEVSSKLSSHKEEAISPTPPHQEDCDLGSKLSSSAPSNPGVRPYSLGAQNHPQLSCGAEFSTFDAYHHPDESEVSHYNRQHLRFLSPSIRSELPSTCGLWLKDNLPQEPNPLLIHREDREISDTLHYARQEHASTRQHEYSYQIITREVSIGASFRQKTHAEARGSVQDLNVGNVTVSASNVQPAEAYGYPDVLPGQLEQRASQAIRRQHRSAFSLVAPLQNEQAAQSGALFGAAVGIGGASTSGAPQLAGPISRVLSREEFAKPEGSLHNRLDSILSDSSDSRFPATIRSMEVSDINAFENDSTFWQQLLDGAQDLKQTDRETRRTAAAAALRRSSFQLRRPSDFAAAPSSEDDNPPHQEWPWSANPALSSTSSGPVRSWPDSDIFPHKGS